VKRKGEMAYFIGRRYGDFSRLHKRLRTELPGKILPPMPRKNRQSSTASNLISGVIGKDDDASSVSSVSTIGALGLEPTIKSLTVQGEKTILST
jgi:PX domain